MLYQGSTLLTNEGGISESDLNLRLQAFKNSLDIDAKLEEFKNSLNLGTADNMFIATYGVTTNAEIEAAYNANKWIFAIYSGRLCPLATRNSATKHYFISNAGTGALQLTCLNNEWSYLTISYANQRHGSTHAPDGSDPITGYSKIKVGSYTGTGTYGSTSPCSLTFDFPPSVVFILSNALGEQQGGSVGDIPVMLTQYRSSINIGGSSTNKVEVTCTFSGNNVSWYGSTAKKQINTSGTVYPYIALG